MHASVIKGWIEVGTCREHTRDMSDDDKERHIISHPIFPITSFLPDTLLSYLERRGGLATV
jgi:hypothetical protein